MNKQIKRQGISLIMLVIVIVVIVILAVAVIATISKNNPIDSAKYAVFLSDTKAIVEETNLYVVSQMAKQSLKYPCKELNSIMLHPAYGDISTETKKIIASVQAKYMPNGLLDIYNIDLNDVYILDSDKIESSKKYKDNIFLIKSSTGDYSLAFNTPVHVLGVDYYELQKVEVANSTQNSGETKIFAIGNNTFKLDKTNHLKGLGQKNEISGATATEIDELKTLYKEFKPNELVPNTVKYKLAYNTAYMLNNNGDLYAIGENSNNKLGLGNEHLQLDTVKLTFPENIKVKDFFCGIRQTFVVDTNNNVWAAGSNEQGEFGLKNTTMYSGFVKITGLDGSKIKDIIFSDNFYFRFTVAIYDNGDVLAAGSNGTATLGAPSYTNTYEFKNISNNWKTNVNIAFPLKQIKISSLINGILDSNDTLWVCGYNNVGQLGNGDKNYQWGFIKYMDNVADFNIKDGVLCKTKTDNIYISPKIVYNELTQKDEYFSEKVLVNNLPVGNKKVIRNYSIYDEVKKQIITKDLAFVLDLKVYYAQSDKKENPTFTVVEDTTTPKNIVDIVNEQQMLILKDNDSKVYLYNQNYITAKGKNIQKELRDINKDQTFEYVDGFGDKIHLIDGEYRLWIGTNDKVLRQNVIKSLVTSTNEYMLLNSGELYSRGKSVGVGYGAGGWGTNDEKIEFVLIQSNVKNIYACCGGAISIDKDNKIYCFGQLWHQFLNLPQYTDNDCSNIHIPTLVTGYINTINIKDIYLLHSNGGAGGTATYIKDDKGDVYSFSHVGNAQYNGIGSNVSDFTKIILPGKVKKIKCGYNYTLCLLENGEVYAWGTNTNGQFGNGYEISKNYPIPQKLNIDAVTEVAAGDGYAIYVKSGDEIYGCGKNEFGQLGDATTKSSAEFVRCINLEK